VISLSLLGCFQSLFAALRAAGTALRTVNQYTIRAPGRVARARRKTESRGPKAAIL